MPTRRALRAFIPAIALIAMSWLFACDSTSPLAQFQPEIVNSPDNFQFQATKIQSVDATLQYFWSNSGTRATVNHSSTVTSGTARLQILDAGGIEVYSAGLIPSGTPATAAGTAGIWTIKVTLSHCYGTLNFRAQKL